MTIQRENLRILLYSHDAVGLGHIRRNQSIACGLSRSLRDPAILMVSGARQSTLFDIPRCVDFVTIPSLRKSSAGEYEARNAGLSMADAIAMRSEILRSTIESFRPDVFVADKVPFGVRGELEPALEVLNVIGTHCVLGLRDILDDPEQACWDWRQQQYDRAIREYYQSVWVYGDQRVYDVAHEYHLRPDIAAKLQYVGYLDRSKPTGHCTKRSDLPPESLACSQQRIALCMVGGGEDGAMVAATFAQSSFPPDMQGVILTGPYMPLTLRERLHAHAATTDQLAVIDFMKSPEWLIERADRVVAMGGYNTVCELLSYEKPCLIVPRVSPRKEQLVRAERLQHAGLLQMLHPSKLNADSVSKWLCDEVEIPTGVRERIDLDGLDRLPELVSKSVPIRIDHGNDADRSPCCLETIQTGTESKL